MDTTPKYILMSEKAVEIQDGWTPERGDRMVVIKDGEILETLRYLSEEEADAAYLCLVKRKKLKERVSIVFIPRQDQLQGMVGQPYSTQAKQLRELACFDDDNTFRTYEQLWMAFLYDRKYNKCWSEDKQDWEVICN